jgi:hypothetical protein
MNGPPCVRFWVAGGAPAQRRAAQRVGLEAGAPADLPVEPLMVARGPLVAVAIVTAAIVMKPARPAAGLPLAAEQPSAMAGAVGSPVGSPEPGWSRRDPRPEVEAPPANEARQFQSSNSPPKPPDQSKVCLESACPLAEQR